MPDSAPSLRQLRRMQDSLTKFIEAFDSMMELHEEDPVAGGPSYKLTPKPDAEDSEVRTRRDAVARRAGECEGISDLTNVTLRVDKKGRVDPITNWGLMTLPNSFLTPAEVRRLAIQAQGSLVRLIMDAETQDAEGPLLGPSSLHPLIWTAAAPQWAMQHFREAVQAGVDALMDRIAEMGQRRDIQERSRWEQLFSTSPAEPGRPRLRWPGDPEDLSVKSMQSGLVQLGGAIQMVIRNPATHTRDQMPEQEALERLAVLSLMARLMSQCREERTERERRPQNPSDE